MFREVSDCPVQPCAQGATRAARAGCRPCGFLASAIAIAWVALLSGFASDVVGQTTTGDKQQTRRKQPSAFRWVNEFPAGRFPGLSHGTFRSERVEQEIGYCIYLPPSYAEDARRDRRYPVVYYLHGGRPGSETKSISLTPYIDRAIRSGAVKPMIYVFVNGGAVSHYDYPQLNSPAEAILIHELIPHIDATYRTIPRREGRGLEGFSQGGRATARIGFGFPHIFCSAASGGGGHATERRVSENDGWENDSLQFQPGANTWDRARQFAADPHPPLHWLFYVGSKGFNYTNNLEYMEFLDTLGIPYRRMIVADVPHSARMIYERHAVDIMRFHEENFAFAGPMEAKQAKNKPAKNKPADGAGRGPTSQAKPPTAVARTLRDVTYATIGDRELKLDLYLPPDDQPSAGLAVWIHGGGWRGGSKKGCPIQWLTAHRHAVASVEFRLSGEARFPAMIHDCKGAIRWLRAHAAEYGYDATNVAVLGGSSGGHMAALVGVTADVSSLEGNVGGNLDQPSRVQAIVDMYGMTDLVYNATVEQARCDLPDCPLFQLVGGKPSEHLEQVALASPVRHVTADDPPILILHGTEDRSLVRPFQGRLLYDAYVRESLNAEFQLIAGAGHGGPEYSDAERRQMILELLTQAAAQPPTQPRSSN